PKKGCVPGGGPRMSSGCEQGRVPGRRGSPPVSVKEHKGKESKPHWFGRSKVRPPLASIIYFPFSAGKRQETFFGPTSAGCHFPVLPLQERDSPPSAKRRIAGVSPSHRTRPVGRGSGLSARLPGLDGARSKAAHAKTQSKPRKILTKPYRTSLCSLRC